jgi:hypothetical protein
LKLYFVGLIIASIFLVQTVSAVTLTAEDNEAKKQIITNASNAVDHRYSQYDLILGSKIGDNSTFTIYNKTAENPVPPDVVIIPNETAPIENETTVENETTTEPEPEPAVNETKIIFGGDFSGSTVINSIKAKNADLNIANGDLGYKSDLSGFKSAWNQVENHKCTIGNHDSPENGNSAIYAEAKQYCGDIWIEKIAGTVIIGFNTNGNLDTQLGTAQNYVMSNQMDGVKNLVLSSHKPCKTPPNSHHTVESNVKTFCDSLVAKVPSGVDIYGVAGHNHVLASTSDDHWFISGAGGRNHYECGTGSGWDFCNNAKYGFLEMVIKDGAIQSTFYDTSGGVLK